MIAFYDAEYNCDEENRSGNPDNSLIDIALVICEDKPPYKEVKTYRSYAKPIKNGGVLYPSIIELTGITQETVDKKGVPFASIFSQMNYLLNAYNVTKIYTWGNMDEYAFRWNCRLYPNLPKYKNIVQKFEDISERVSQELFGEAQGQNMISLENIAYICDVDSKDHHSALADAVILKEVVCAVDLKKFDRTKLKEYSKYARRRDAYNKLKASINRIRQIDEDLDELIVMAVGGEKYPPFIDEEK